MRRFIFYTINDFFVWPPTSGLAGIYSCDYLNKDYTSGNLEFTPNPECKKIKLKNPKN